MCTSFVWRKNGDVIVGMNFDNDGKNFSLAADEHKQFTVLVNKVPSFGVNIDGTFVNHLAVDSEGEGTYRRGKNVVHTVKLITDLLNNKLEPDQLTEYLSQKEVVNVPDNSCHSLISDSSGNAWLIEPGRGSISSPASSSPFFLMTNYPLIGVTAAEHKNGTGADRYETAEKLLNKFDQLDVKRAFEVLESVKQSGETWKTEFSMVYIKSENAVYYCQNGDFANIQKFQFDR